MTDRIQFDPAVFRQKSPEEALKVLVRLETEIREKISQLGNGVQVGPPVVDWSVDQILFVLKAFSLFEAHGLPNGDTLWLLEMLSLPECQRRARRKWQRRRLLDEALVKKNLRWRDVLLNRQRTEKVKHIPRQLQFYPRQLTPYQSSIRCPKRWPNPWKIPLDFFLSIQSWPIKGGSTLQPLLSGSSISFSIQLRTPAGTLLLDVPRNYDREQCIEQLHHYKEQLERHLARLEDGTFKLPSLGEGGQRFIGILGWGRTFAKAQDKESLRLSWTDLSAQLNRDIERLAGGKVKRSQRASIMQKYFAIPWTMPLTPVWILPLDLPPALLPMFIGAWMFMQGLLSTRQQRTVAAFIEGRLMALDRQIEPSRARGLVPEVIWRLGRFDRPLRGASVQSYLRRVLRRGRFSSRGSLSLRKRVPKGSLQEVARRLGCHPRTVARHYRRYCQSRKLNPGSLAAWVRFRKYLSRGGWKRPNT